MLRILASVLLVVLAACDSSSSDCTQTMCGSSCVDVTTDPLNCGACGHSCGLGTCTASQCTCPSSSPPTVMMCPNDPATGWTCVDLTTDPAQLWGLRPLLRAGDLHGFPVHVQFVAAPVVLCPNNPVTGTCIDTASDLQNCGNCGHSCTYDWSANVICTNVVMRVSPRYHSVSGRWHRDVGMRHRLVPVSLTRPSRTRPVA